MFFPPVLGEVDSVVRLYDWYSDSFAFYLAMERPGKTDLCDYLIQNDCDLNEEQALVVFRQLVEIAYRCAELDIVHRDLKEDNLILCSESMLTVKVIDFGAATSISANTLSKQFVGTREYFAPEQRLRLPYDPLAATVYSLGAILYSLMQGQPPSGRGPVVFLNPLSCSSRELILRCMSAKSTYRPSLRGAILYSLTQGQQPSSRGPDMFMNPLSCSTRELILRCMSAKPTYRPSLRDLMALF